MAIEERTLRTQTSVIYFSNKRGIERVIMYPGEFNIPEGRIQLFVDGRNTAYIVKREDSKLVPNPEGNDDILTLNYVFTREE